jgi:hypothetical protein
MVQNSTGFPDCRIRIMGNSELAQHRAKIEEDALANHPSAVETKDDDHRQDHLGS